MWVNSSCTLDIRQLNPTSWTSANGYNRKVQLTGFRSFAKHATPTESVDIKKCSLPLSGSFDEKIAVKLPRSAATIYGMARWNLPKH
ncbi:hypothetical protein CEXT_722731 [Caerostris extrusa]|uniref:Uncharacterized protein n=1 Tax=Caerostris extrusa TaxID=172846 RepID=A0AAV4QSU9_CAEEX|nr:hypothetical protein CEXT_722731 [Caerostris extrusa]